MTATLSVSLIFPAFDLRHLIFLGIHSPCEGVALGQAGLGLSLCLFLVSLGVLSPFLMSCLSVL